MHCARRRPLAVFAPMLLIAICCVCYSYRYSYHHAFSMLVTL